MFGRCLRARRDTDEPDGYLPDGTPVYDPPWPPDPERLFYADEGEGTPPEMCVARPEIPGGPIPY